MVPKTVGSIVALFVLAICFAACYGQQQVRICENGVCRIVEVPQAKIEAPIEAPAVSTPAFPTMVYREATHAPRTTTNRQGLFQRLGSRLRGLGCRR